jgi:GNAT superfamily N-acetyltransferase
MKYKIEQITAVDESEALQVLTMAIVNDPGIVFFSPNAVKRVYHTMRMVNGMSWLLSDFGKKYMIKEKGKIVAIAMWVPPGESITNWRLLKTGFLLIPFIMGLRVFRGIMKFLDIATRLQEDLMKNRNHWYLYYLAVHPAHQRRGYGSAIISEILSESDKTQTPIFIQVLTEDGIRFFTKNGFHEVSKISFSENCIMSCMIREPLQKKTGAVKSNKNKSASPEKVLKPEPTRKPVGKKPIKKLK